MARSIAALLIVALVACHDPDDGDGRGIESAGPPAEPATATSASVPPAPYDPFHESDPATEALAYDGLQGKWAVSGAPGLLGKKGQAVIIRENVMALPEESYDNHRGLRVYESRKTMRLLRVAQAGSFAFDLDHRGYFDPGEPDSTIVEGKGWSRRVSARLSADGKHLTLALATPSMTAPPFIASPQVEIVELEAVTLTPSWNATTWLSRKR